MNIDEFAHWARNGQGSLRVDDITIKTPDGTFEGRGTLKSEHEHLVLIVTLSGGIQLPHVYGIYPREHFWEIQGKIEEQLLFCADGLSGERFTSFGPNALQQATFSLDYLSLVTDQTRANELEASKLNECDNNAPLLFLGYAYLEEFKPMWFNMGTIIKTTNEFLGDHVRQTASSFRGAVDDFEFALIRVEKDCEAYLRTKKGRNVSEERFRATFTAFRAAIAFIHGREAWPQRLSIKHGNIRLQDDIYPHRELPSTRFTLLSEAACANGADLESALVLATRYFLRNDAQSKLVLRALYLCRQSSMGVTPLDVGTLTICAVFEGLITELHGHIVSNGETDEVRAFELAKKELIALARRRENEGTPGFSRLLGLLTSARPHQVKGTVNWLVEHLNLRWEPGMEEVFKAWKSERNILAHGGELDGNPSDRMRNQSRIAGAINLIVARLIGYTGLAIYSALEDRYVNLTPSDEPVS